MRLSLSVACGETVELVAGGRCAGRGFWARQGSKGEKSCAVSGVGFGAAMAQEKGRSCAVLSVPVARWRAAGFNSALSAVVAACWSWDRSGIS